METYLDNAATSHPKPPAVLDAVRRALTEDNANPGRSGHPRALRAAEAVLNARETLAGLLGAQDPFSILFTFNCTDALNLAIKGILRPGDHVIASALEHNSVLRVIKTLEASGGVETTILSPQPDGFLDPARYAAAIRPNTRLLILTHASNVTGAIQPVREVVRVARANGILSLIDGAQALGELPVNVESLGCDLYAFPGHKTLLGPQGTGGLYLAPGLRLETLREGGTGSSSELLVQPEELPERYEAGTLNLPGIEGLGTGAQYVRENAAAIAERVHLLSQALYQSLRAIPGVTVYSPGDARRRTGIVSFNVGDLSSARVAQTLGDREICVRGGLHCAPEAHRFLGTLSRGCVRASIGAFNTAEDIETLVRAVDEIARKG